MKLKNLSLAVIISVIWCTNLSGQKLSEGSLNFLKGVKQLDVVFDYSSVLIQGNTEADTYLKNGEAWAEQWENAKINTFYKQFIGHLNKNVNAQKFLLQCGNFPEAEYYAVIKFISFGRIWGVECEVLFYRGSETTPLAVITKLKGDSRRFGGIGGIGGNAYLAASACSFAGQNLGKFLAKKIK